MVRWVCQIHWLDGTTISPGYFQHDPQGIKHNFMSRFVLPSFRVDIIMRGGSILLLTCVSGLCLLGLIGCGGLPKGELVEVSVIFAKNSGPLPEDQIDVTFVPEDPAARRGGGVLSADGKTTIKGTDKNTGLLPGKYAIMIHVNPMMPKRDSVRLKELEAFNKKYAESATPLHCELTGDPGQSIVIDLVNNKVKKG
jgi:hypothetical protein